MAMPTLGQAIRDAIEAELAAARFYDDLAARTDDAIARRFLRDLAGVEHMHGSSIATEARGLGAVPDFASDDAEWIETLPEWREADAVTLDEALEIAIACERKAGATYLAWASAFEGRGGEFFRRLAGSESEHEVMIERVLSQRVASQRAHMPLPQIGRNIVQAERVSARLYSRLAERLSDHRVRRFLAGMAEVQDTTAADAELRVVELAGQPLAPRPNLPLSRFDTPPGTVVEHALDLAAAMRSSLAAERRASLVFRSMRRYVDGAEAELVTDIAVAEEAHAKRIEAALARV